MNELPSEIISSIIQHLSGADILNFCNVNSVVASICDESNEYIWKEKTQKDYKAYNIPPKPTGMSWKKFYINLSTRNDFIKQVLVQYNQNPEVIELGKIWISNSNTPEKILEAARDLLAKYPNLKQEGLTVYGYPNLTSITRKELLLLWNNGRLLINKPNYYKDLYRIQFVNHVRIDPTIRLLPNIGALNLNSDSN